MSEVKEMWMVICQGHPNGTCASLIDAKSRAEAVLRANKGDNRKVYIAKVWSHVELMSPPTNTVMYP